MNIISKITMNKFIIPDPSNNVTGSTEMIKIAIKFSSLIMPFEFSINFLKKITLSCKLKL